MGWSTTRATLAIAFLMAAMISPAGPGNAHGGAPAGQRMPARAEACATCSISWPVGTSPIFEPRLSVITPVI